MKLLETIIKIGGLLIIIGVIVMAVWLLPTLKKFRSYQDNTEQLMNKLPDQTLYLTKRDFKSYLKESNDSLLRKINDSLNIKPRHVVRTINHRYHYTYDSTYTVVQGGGDQEGNKPFSKEFDKCLIVRGRFNTDTIFWDEVSIDYSAQTVYYWSRKKLLGFIPIGRKTFHAVTENSCTGMTETKEINLIKYKD